MHVIWSGGGQARGLQAPWAAPAVCTRGAGGVPGKSDQILRLVAPAEAACTRRKSSVLS